MTVRTKRILGLKLGQIHVEINKTGEKWSYFANSRKEINVRPTLCSGKIDLSQGCGIPIPLLIPFHLFFFILSDVQVTESQASSLDQSPTHWRLPVVLVGQETGLSQL